MELIGIEMASGFPIRVYDKAKVDWKAERTRRYVSIFSRPSTPSEALIGNHVAISKDFA